MTLREEVEAELDRQRLIARNSREDNRAAEAPTAKNAAALSAVIHEANADALETILLLAGDA